MVAPLLASPTSTQLLDIRGLCPHLSVNLFGQINGCKIYWHFSKRKFDLDANLVVTTTDADPGVTLTSVRTIRCILVNTSITGNATVVFNVGGQDVTFTASDLDLSGVGIAHVRGALCDADNLVKYTATAGSGTVSVGAAFLDMVENIG